MSPAATRVWTGPPALRRFLVPIDSLEPFPGNPRRGEVEKLRESLRRFGQVLPALADPELADGERMRIVARHHLILAAQEEGWTHVAVIANEFGSEEEARAYLVADNQLGRIGAVDPEALAEQLAAISALEGTGFSDEDRAELDRQLAEMHAAFAPSGTPPPALDARSPSSGLFEVPLLLTPDDRQDFVRLMQMHKREWGINDVTAIVLRSLRESAARL